MNELSYYLDTCPDFVKNNFSFEKFNTFDKILVQNEKSDFVYIIIKGKVKVYSLTPTGVKYLERIYCEYEIFGELEAFIDKPILNYVEAMNELDQAYTINDITVTRNTSEMKRCFNLIRYRAGLPGITDADVANVERMRELIARERQIEFAWEGRRYHDLRRTKKAIIYENAPVMGCDVSATEAEKDKFYNIIQVKERDWIYKVFTRRQTFFPIPKSEVDKNPNLDQMPGF